MGYYEIVSQKVCLHFSSGNYLSQCFSAISCD